MRGFRLVACLLAVSLLGSGSSAAAGVSVDEQVLVEDRDVQALAMFGRHYRQLSSEQRSFIQKFVLYRAEIRADASRPYQQLTLPEKKKLHDLYEAMASGDEPPYPLHGIWSYSDPLGKIAFGKRLVGRLYVLLTVDGSGQVAGQDFLAMPEGTPQASVEQILKEIPFKPAVCAGQPCSMEYLIDMRFDRYPAN